MPNAATAPADHADHSARVRADRQKNNETAAAARTEEFARGFAAVNHAGMQAAVEASRTYTEGMLELWRRSADMAQAVFATMFASCRDLASARSPAEFLELQTKIAREVTSTVAEETNRFAEASVKVAQTSVVAATKETAGAAEQFHAQARGASQSRRH